MAITPATESLANYIHESGLGRLPAALPSNVSINEQLHDLRNQFARGIKHLQPSLSMPHLKNQACHRGSFDFKMRRPSINNFADSRTHNVRAVGTSNADQQRNVIAREQTLSCNLEINRKLDLLIEVVNAQQNLLCTLVHNCEKQKAAPVVQCQSTQTSRSDTIHPTPRIISHNSPLTQQYPSIPTSPVANKTQPTAQLPNNHISLPCDTLLKLLQSASGGAKPSSPLKPVMRPQFNVQHHLTDDARMLGSPKSTLYFSD